MSVGWPPTLLGRGHLHTYLHGQPGEPVFPILPAPVTSPTPSFSSYTSWRWEDWQGLPAPGSTTTDVRLDCQFLPAWSRWLGERVESKKVSILVVWTHETVSLPYKRQCKLQGTAGSFLVTNTDTGDSEDGLSRGQRKQKRGCVLGKKTKKLKVSNMAWWSLHSLYCCTNSPPTYPERLSLMSRQIPEEEEIEAWGKERLEWVQYQWEWQWVIGWSFHAASSQRGGGECSSSRRKVQATESYACPLAPCKTNHQR